MVPAGPREEGAASPMRPASDARPERVPRPLQSRPGCRPSTFSPKITCRGTQPVSSGAVSPAPILSPLLQTFLCSVALQKEFTCRRENFILRLAMVFHWAFASCSRPFQRISAVSCDGQSCLH